MTDNGQTVDYGKIVRVLFYQQLQMKSMIDEIMRYQAEQKSSFEKEMFSSKKFLRPNDAKSYYGVGESTMKKIAIYAHAFVKVDKLKWVDTEAVDKFLALARL